MIEMRLSGLNDLKIIFTLVQSVRFRAKLSFGLLCGMENQALRVKLFGAQVELKICIPSVLSFYKILRAKLSLLFRH